MTTETELNQMTSGELVALHNKHAKAAGVPSVKRFATKASAIRRTWAVVELVQKRAAKKTTPAPASKVVTKVAPAKAHEDKILCAGAPPEGRPGIIHAIHSIAAKARILAREELVAKALAEFTPPRSQCYDRAYVLGYIAYGLRQGYLKEA
ncbi:hypothetical protein [Rhodanobacter soli]